MRKSIKYVMSLPLLALFSCNDFMDLDTYQNIPATDAYKMVQDVQNGMNGAYYALGDDYFYGRNVVAIGDLSSDNAVASASTGHFLSINKYTFSDTDGELDALWIGGYRVLDRATRTINGAYGVLADKMLNLTATDSASLHSVISQCYALRALTTHVLVNVFGLPYQANQANSQLGVVLLTKEPQEPFTMVSRATVGETYSQISLDIAAAKATYAYVDNYNLDNEDDAILLNQFYMNKAAIYALEARVALFMKDYEGAINAADSAIILRGAAPVSDETYQNMWASTAITNEDIFTIPKSEDDNLSANSLNTLYGSYKAKLTTAMKGLFAVNDIRLKLINVSTMHPRKFDGIPTSQAVSNIPVFRVSEMYLIMAEAYAQQDDVANAQVALLFTAKRNPAIVSVSNLPSTKAALLTFIADERRRELFEEGFRWYDARRTGELISVSDGAYTSFNVSAFVYPVPASEINAGFGVVQNQDWATGLPE